MPDVVVADAGPLISAARANRIHLIEHVYTRLIIPPAVVQEIVVGGKGKPGADLLRYGWIEESEPRNTASITQLHARFGLGESEAIVLAEELSAFLFADEVKVIGEARRRNIPVTSTLQMLLIAKQKGIIPEVKQELDKYMQTYS